MWRSCWIALVAGLSLCAADPPSAQVANYHLDFGFGQVARPWVTPELLVGIDPFYLQGDWREVAGMQGQTLFIPAGRKRNAGAVVEIFSHIPQDRQERIADFSAWIYPSLMKAFKVGESCSVTAYQAAQIMASVLDPAAGYAKPPLPAEVWYNCLWGSLQEPGWAISAGKPSVQARAFGSR